MSNDPHLTDVQDVCMKLLRVAPEKVGPEVRLVEDLDMDSLFAAELGLALERRFNLEISEETLASLKTISDVAAHITQRRAEISA